MRSVTRIARALLGAFWTAVESEPDTDRGFIQRAEQILNREEQRRRAFAVTPRTTRVRFVDNRPPADRKAEPS
jgi:hypothetical protein